MFAESRHRSRTRTSEQKHDREEKQRNNQENLESTSKILEILSEVANTSSKSQTSSRGREVGRERDKRIQNANEKEINRKSRKGLVKSRKYYLAPTAHSGSHQRADIL